MENSNLLQTDNFKESGLGVYAKSLIFAGVIGFILTVIFWFYGKDLATDGTSGAIFEKHVPELVLYYSINSFLVLISGIFLLNRLKIGIAILVIVFVSVFGSLFIVDRGTNLFLWTVTSSIWVFYTGAPIGVLFFLGTLSANMFRVGKWIKNI